MWTEKESVSVTDANNQSLVCPILFSNKKPRFKKGKMRVPPSPACFFTHSSLFTVIYTKQEKGSLIYQRMEHDMDDYIPNLLTVYRNSICQ